MKLSPKKLLKDTLIVSAMTIGILLLTWGPLIGYSIYINRDDGVFKTTQIYDISSILTKPKTPHSPDLPDISSYTVENIVAKAPGYFPGLIDIKGMAGIPEFAEFVKVDGRVQLMRMSQKDALPKAIVIESGSYDWPHFYEAVQKINPDAIKKDGKTFLLRFPVLVNKNASLRIDGADVGTLRLSKERTAFLVNAGQMFILNTKVVGWSEKSNKQSYFAKKDAFRPFIVSWSGGKMFLAGNKIESLGYLKGKSYGISYSACEDCKKIAPNVPAATGAVVGNTFKDNYYGFYCYEAEDVAIVGNTYADNIIYGIDPHDRSKRLIIAKNDSYGAKHKHGIIVSREVNDSWIFDNHSHHNEGSGIMIDRSSVNNIVANNISENNKQDGITFFESQNNLTWKNIVRNNGRSGVKIRNSWDIRMFNDQILNNKGVAIEIYAISIEDQKTRDFELDPYHQRASAAAISGVTVNSPISSVFKIGKIDVMVLEKLFITPPDAQLFANNDLTNNTVLLSLLRSGEKAIMVTPENKGHNGVKMGSIKMLE